MQALEESFAQLSLAQLQKLYERLEVRISQRIFPDAPDFYESALKCLQTKTVTKKTTAAFEHFIWHQMALQIGTGEKNAEPIRSIDTTWEGFDPKTDSKIWFSASADHGMGIDGIMVDIEAKTIYFYQLKWGNTEITLGKTNSQAQYMKPIYKKLSDQAVNYFNSFKDTFPMLKTFKTRLHLVTSRSVNNEARKYLKDNKCHLIQQKELWNTVWSDQIKEAIRTSPCLVYLKCD